jgi:hypothetical protein
MRRADQWSTYATRFRDTNQLVACLDQVVVLALTEHPQAKGWHESTTKHREWLEEQGIPANLDAAVAVRDLFTRLDYLDRQPQGSAVAELIVRAAGLQDPTP